MKRNELLNYRFRVQEKKKLRVILDTDAACEADDPYAIVHALLTPRFLVKGILAEQFSLEGGGDSVEKSLQTIQKILELMDIDDVPVFRGAPRLESENAVPDSAAADFIIREALAESEHPLFVLCMGAVTNVAIALKKCPRIAGRFTCVWIGGGAYPEGGWEFNLLNDPVAANILFSSQAELWQVPMDCYTQMQIGYAELESKVYPRGNIGRFLFEQLQALGLKADWICGEAWGLGDSPAVGLALNPGCGRYRMQNAPMTDGRGYYTPCPENRPIRVYTQIDSRYILEDLFAKLLLCYPEFDKGSKGSLIL